MPGELFQMIKNQEPITFSVIPKNQYHSAVKDFMLHAIPGKPGQFTRFPEKYIFEWKSLLLENIAKLATLTRIHGHSQWFPTDEFYDVFDYNSKTGESGGGLFSRWLNKKQKEGEKYKRDDWGAMYTFLDTVFHIGDVAPQFSNGHHVLSDYATEPLMRLGLELDAQTDPNEIIVTISRILDVVHQRSDIAELFIEGGSSSLYDISNN